MYYILSRRAKTASGAKFCHGVPFFVTFPGRCRLGTLFAGDGLNRRKYGKNRRRRTFGTAVALMVCQPSQSTMTALIT